MAAAEYYNTGADVASHPSLAPSSRPPHQQQQPRPQQSYPPPSNYHQAPPPPAPSNQSQLNLAPPYPMSDQPPPYSEQRPHSQPPPGQRIPQNFNSPAFQPYRAPQQGQSSTETHQYPAEKLPQQPQRPGMPPNGFRASEYPAAYPPPPQNNAYPSPMTVAPGLSQAYNGGTWSQQRPPSSGNSPYRRSSRSRSREKRKHSKPKPELQRQKSSGMNTFLGAGGGAIIGDLIFPGLGTLSGAVLGGLGGHEYGRNKRSSSNPGRTHRRSYSSSEDDSRRGRK